MIICDPRELTAVDARVGPEEITNFAPGSIRLLPTDPGEITTKFHIEYLTKFYFNTWTEYKNQIILIVRARIYPGRKPIICFDSQVISRILRDTW